MGGGWGTEIRDVYILGGVVPCGRFGVRLRVGNVNIGGGGPCGGGATGGLGTAMGDANIMKGWSVLRQTLDNIVGGWGPEAEIGKIQYSGGGCDRVGGLRTDIGDINIVGGGLGDRD